MRTLHELERTASARSREVSPQEEAHSRKFNKKNIEGSPRENFPTENEKIAGPSPQPSSPRKDSKDGKIENYYSPYCSLLLS